VSPLACLKLGAGAAILALLIWAGLAVNGWRNDSLALANAEARTAEIAQQARDAMATLAEAHKDALDASQGLQNELQTLRDNRKPAPVVRLCREPRVPTGPAKGAGAPGRDGSGPAAGELPQTLGPDIGGDLYGLADDADEVAARLRACQALLK